MAFQRSIAIEESWLVTALRVRAVIAGEQHECVVGDF